jgi:hypothetical protein
VPRKIMEAVTARIKCTDASPRFLYTHQMNRMLTTPLSNTQLEALLPGVPIHEYKHLSSFATLDDALGPSTHCAIVFVETAPSTGHWTCIGRDGDGRCFFFDPYSFPPDQMKAVLSEKKQRALGEDKPELMRLFERSGIPLRDVDVSMHQWQSERPAIATCGCHCAFRLSWRQLCNTAYGDMLAGVCKRYRETPDELVACATWGHLKSGEPMI